MLLGRNTQQWLAGIGVVLTVLSQYVSPEAVGTAFGVTFHIATALAVLTALDVGLMGWIAQTSTTPSQDPQLKVGTMVRVTDSTGTLIAHTPVPQPAAPPTADPLETTVVRPG